MFIKGKFGQNNPKLNLDWCTTRNITVYVQRFFEIEECRADKDKTKLR